MRATTTAERIAVGGYALHYADGSWWACGADGVLVSRFALVPDDCWALFQRGALVAHDSHGTATLYRMVEQ